MNVILEEKNIRWYVISSELKFYEIILTFVYALLEI
jgi:hypothetical protein